MNSSSLCISKFRGNAHIKSISLRTDPSCGSQAPKQIKLFTNQLSFGFENAEDLKATQTVELSEEEVTSAEGAVVQLLPAKFQRVEALHVSQFATLEVPVTLLTHFLHTGLCRIKSRRRCDPNRRD